jgi:hypothetical protein
VNEKAINWKAYMETYDFSVYFQERSKATSDFLFPKPSIIYGFARLLDLGATLDVYNESPAPALADWLALYSDWTIVGDDMRDAFKKVLEESMVMEHENAQKEQNTEYAAR